jgi:hypothetical protein
MNFIKKTFLRLDKPDNSPTLLSKKFDIFVYFFSQGLFLLGLIFLIFTQLYIENTIFGMRLFWISIICGIFVGLMLIILLRWISPAIYRQRNKRISVYLGFFLGFAIFTPAITSFINKTLADNSIICNQYLVESKFRGSKGNRTFYLQIIIQKKEEQFIIDKEIYDRIENGGQIQLCTLKGKLGFEFVTEFKPVD